MFDQVYLTVLSSIHFIITDEAVRYWDVGNDALNVETTAYALLAQMALGRLKFSGPIVTWLTGQRDPQGGFVSTQVCQYMPKNKMYLSLELLESHPETVKISDFTHVTYCWSIRHWNFWCTLRIISG